MYMKCIYCQGTMEKGFAPFHIDRKGYHLTIDNVPAWVCGQCGEFYFDEHEVDSVQEILKTLEDRMNKMTEVA